MKKIATFLLSAFIIAESAILSLADSGISDLNSEGICLMDATTGQVLFEKNMHKALEPASITKIMTAALAMEKGYDDSSKVTMTDDAVWSVGRDTTHIALTPGEIVPVKDLIYGTLVQSANDCANGLALYVDGDLEKFAEHMNRKALELGALNTHFLNANGLPEKGHYTTAYDMALITKWAITLPGFREVFGADEYVIPPTNLQKDERHLYQKHKSLNPYSDFYYEYATGGKTGWTEEAMNTASTIAQKDGMELIAVTIGSKEAKGRYTDIINVFDYGFAHFNHAEFSKERFSQAPVPVYRGEEKIGEVKIIPEDIVITKPATAAKAEITIGLNLPIRYAENDKIDPKAQFILDDHIIAEVPLKYEKNIESDKAVVLAVKDEKQDKDGGFYIPAWICFTFAFIFLIIFLLFGIRSINIIRYNKMVDRRNAREAREAKNTRRAYDQYSYESYVKERNQTERHKR